MFGSSTFQFGQQQQQQQQPAQGGLFGQPAQTGFGAAAPTSAFGAPATGFGQPAQQPATGFGGTTTTFGGFGTQNRPAFGAAPTTSTSLFGTQTQNAAPTTGFGTFGSNTTAATSAQPAGGIFGAKPTGFGTATGFGQPAAAPAFGAGTTTSAFGQQPQTTAFGATATTGFGASNQTTPQQNCGTGNPPFQAYSERDTSATGPTNNVFQSITAMANYKNWSLEELRLQDYAMGKKAPTAGAPGFGQTGAFGQTAPTTGGLFGSTSATSGFGQPQQQPQQTLGAGLFGAQNTTTAAPATGFGGFGQAQQPATTAFGQPQQTGGLFGATTTGFGAQQPATTQPAATGFGAGFGFGTPQSQQKPAFGFGATSATTTPAAPTGFGGFGQPAAQPATSTSPFGFGQTAQPAQQQQQTGFSLFGAKATTPTAPAAPAATGFGGFGTATTQAAAPASTFSFGATVPSAPAAGAGLFGAKPATAGGFSFGATATTTAGTAPTFSFSQPAQQQQQAPATGGFSFGAPAAQPQQGGLFGTTAAPAAGGLFGQAAAKPATGLFGAPATTQPAASTFSFGQPAATGGGLFGATAPAAPAFSLGQPATAQTSAQGLFGATTTPQAGGGLFGQPAAQPSPFGASTQAAPAPALGGSLFGASTAPANVGFGTQLPPGQQPLVATIDQNPYGINPVLDQARSTATTPVGSASGANANGPSSAGASPSASDQARKPVPLPQFKVTPRLQTRLKLKNFGSSIGGTSVASSELGAIDSLDSIISPEKFNPRKNVKKLTLSNADILSSSVGMGMADARPKETRKEITWGDDAPAKEQVPVGTPPSEGASVAPPKPGPASESPSANGIYPQLDDIAESRQHRQSIPPETPKSSAADSAPEASSVRLSPRSPSGSDPINYVTQPPMHELLDWSEEKLRRVSNFSVALKDVGKITFLQPVDLLSAAPDGTKGTIPLIPARVVVFKPKLVVVYPGEEGKPPVGQGLNVPARIELLDCWPLDRSTRQPIKDAASKRMDNHRHRLETMEGTKFIDFDPKTGKWVFEVQHFTVYGLLQRGVDNEDVLVEDLVEDSDGFMKPAPFGTRLIGFADDDSVMGDSSLVEDSFAYTKKAPQRRFVRRIEEEVDEELDDLVEEITHRDGEAMDDSEDDPLGGDAALERQQSQIAEDWNTGGDDSAGGYESVFLEAAASPEQQQSGDFVRPSLQDAMKADLFGQKTGSAKAPSATSFGLRSFFGSGPPPSRVNESVPQAVAELEREAGRAESRSMDLEEDAAQQRDTISTPEAVIQRPAAPRKARELDAVVPLAKSVVAGKESLFRDAGFAMGRSFRVGWGPNGTFASPGRMKQGMLEFGTVVVRTLDVFPHAAAGAAASASKDSLERHFRHSIVETRGGAPCAYICPGSKFADYVQTTSGKPHFSETEKQSWRLGRALMDPLDIPSECDDAGLSESQQSQARSMYRKAAVSRWLRGAVAKSAEEEAGVQGRDPADVIFSHLSCCNVPKACLFAVSSRDFRLATVLSQLGGNGLAPGAVRSRAAEGRGAPLVCFGHGVPGSNSLPQNVLMQLRNQIRVWREPAGKAPARFFDAKRLRIWELAAGNVANELVGGSLRDWKRVFGLFLWYEDGGSSSLAQVLRSYSAAYSTRGTGIVKPLPLYLERTGSGSADEHLDVLFHLLLLSVSDRHLLEVALHPLNIGPHILDYRLSWLLYSMISRSYKFREFRDTKIDTVFLENRDGMALDGDAIEQHAGFQAVGGTTADNLTMSLAFQLERSGLWQWAIYACLFLSGADSRHQAIRELLCRNFPLDDASESVMTLIFGSPDSVKPAASDAWQFLTTKLHIPAAWIHEAKALKSRYQGNLRQEIASLIDAQQYVEAHRLIVRVVAPGMILNGDHDLLKRLLVELKQHGSIKDWSTGGDLLLTFMDLVSGEPSRKPEPSRASGLGRDALPPGALRPFQATAFNVPPMPTAAALAEKLAATQKLLDRIAALERSQIKDGRAGYSEQEIQAEDLDLRACLAHMRKRLEHLSIDLRKKQGSGSMTGHASLPPPLVSDNWFRGVGGLA
ncbi:nuclear protein 96-domain-containing protein [Hyaloraphidium curvatum]|nr:nuclear protein 96-domain-containing protein [Hyaloraphidium curvatum]